LVMTPEKSTVSWAKTLVKIPHKKKPKHAEKRHSGCVTFIYPSNQRTKIQKLFLIFSLYNINPLIFAKNHGNKNSISRADAPHDDCRLCRATTYHRQRRCALSSHPTAKYPFDDLVGPAGCGQNNTRIDYFNT